ncbi:MAG TPA: iron ABC transporter permease [Myxococcota bacterium]|nr:iron ABC transporter permease [Myxococcota bacterium]
MSARHARALAALGLLLGLALAASLAVGSAQHASADIVLDIRLPRALLAALVGAGLATAGALLQALLQNPLADPYVLGISGGAALGGVLALALGGVWLGGAFVPLVAFAGALGASLLLYALAAAGGRAPAHSLLLTGVVFNAFASSLIVFATSATDLARVAGVFLWLIGSIRLVEPAVLVGVALLFAVGLAIALRFAYALNLIAQGDETASHLGVDVPAVRRWILAGTALMIGASVAVSGLIGFVGLIVPHLLRLSLGSDHRLLVPASALGGAAFLVVADTLARVVLAPTELPVGALTSLVGGPLFLVLLRRELARLPS